MFDVAPITGTLGAESVVNSAEELIRAMHDPSVQTITVAQNLTGVPEIHLPPNKIIRGRPDRPSVLQFMKGTNGLCLTSNNSVSNLMLLTSADFCAIWNDDTVGSLGMLALRSISTIGSVRLLARNAVRSGHVEVEDLDIVAADARSGIEKPHGYGVDVLQSGFTLWNMQPDATVKITANLVGLSAGRPGAAVLGGGIFIAGAGETGGQLAVRRLETNAVYCDGRIEPGTADCISGGVFVLYGARVDSVVTHGPVVTYGPNDMALDNWGAVDHWVSDEKITTYGPSGVGFVNFGQIDQLTINAPIETFGVGARGFNVYTGTIRSAEFDRIVTHGDGAVGVQISRPVGRLIFRRGIETFGAIGQSLVKGVLQDLPATPLSVKPGGSAREIRIFGGLRSHGKGVLPLEQQGSVEDLHIEGGCSPGNAGAHQD
jgi:hypothetical protein